VYNITMATK